VNRDLCELLFRILFSLIFLTLGGEHILSDDLVLGWRLRFAALLLGSFVIVATLAVHIPAILMKPEFVTDSNMWMWDILQRSNLAKNVCLLGVCILLWHHEPGRWSLKERLKTKG
jgi:uncharacterized membrane protein YphA (DoxX/SURF4 family)